MYANTKPHKRDKMKIDILTLFPEMFDALDTSLIGRAQNNNLVEINKINIRDFSKNKHGKVDDYVFGGGDGMLMCPQPLYDAINSVKTNNSHVIYLSPKGKPLTQSIVKDISKKSHLILVCGHYEGIDQRIIDLCVDEEISIGDYILTGGELPAMVLTDALLRYIPGVLGNENSAKEESFSDGLLEHPQYTRPREFKGLSVPKVLLSGNHAEIEKWKIEQKLLETKKHRKDLYEKYNNKNK